MKQTRKLYGAYKDSSREGQVEAIILQLETEIERTKEEIKKEEAALAVNRKILMVLDFLKTEKPPEGVDMRSLLEEIDAEIWRLDKEDQECWPSVKVDAEEVLGKE